MFKQKLKKFTKIKLTRVSLLAFTVLFLAISLAPRFTGVGHASIQDQINQLQSENQNYRSELDKLAAQATSYKDAIAKLQAEIDQLQGQIDANTKEQARLGGEIQAAEDELVKQKKVLGENIKAMYLEGQITTLEMLATSKDLSEFVDKEQYRNTVKDKIRDTLEKVTALKHELSAKKEAVDNLLKEQKTKQDRLASSRAEQNNLLAYNENQQADFNQRTKDNQSKIDDLVAQQRRANFNPDGGYYFIRFPGAAGGVNPDAYPYKYAGFGMSPGAGCVDGDGPDAWGYCTRQCVSYAAWAVVASGRSAPMYWGNARDWVAAAYARGIPVSRSPQPGDVAISTSGFWGHAMYVQGVSGNSFTTSEYNTYLTGQLSYQTRTWY